MNKQLETQLAEQFPFMKKGNPSEDPSPYAAYGCEIDDGWYSILEGMCEDVAAAYEKVGIPVDFQPQQIKEKFGGLRVYYFFKNNADTEAVAQLHRDIRAIVDKWTLKSATVCEKCGQRGKPRTKRSYIQTLCWRCSLRR